MESMLKTLLDLLFPLPCNRQMYGYPWRITITLHCQDSAILPGRSDSGFTWLSTRPDNVGIQISPRLGWVLSCLNPFRVVNWPASGCWSRLWDQSISVLEDCWLILGQFWANRDWDASQAPVDIVRVVPSLGIEPLMIHFWIPPTIGS